MITEREREILTRVFGEEVKSPDWYVGMMALYIAREEPQRDVNTIVKQVDALFTDFESVYSKLNEEEADAELIDDRTIET